MVQVKIVSGKMAGTERFARRFPFKIGRSAGADLQLSDEGVWDEHVELAFVRREGIVLSACKEALVMVNSAPTKGLTLRNGDTIEIGGAKLRFWLSPTHQSNLKAQEILIWIGFVLVTIFQFYLIYWFTP